MTTITAERNGLAKVGLTLRRREQWGARRSYTDARTVSEPATRVFVHITITNPSNYNSRDAHARAVESIGISRFPATGISYNRMVFAGTDTIYEAQPIGRRGAHTVNDFRRSTCSTSGCPGRTASLTAPSWNLNYNARAYVICQNTQHTVTDQMVTALARAIAADARAGFVTEYAAMRPHGHRCVSAKSCPGNLMWAKMGSLKTKIAVFLSRPATIGGGTDGTTIPDPTVPGGFDPEEDDMPALKDMDADDRKALREALHGQNLFTGNRIVKGTDKNEDWHWRTLLARQEANTALLAQVVGNDPGNSLSAEQVKAIVEQAIVDNVIKVDVSIEGAPE
jgi:hypothetical protein